MNIKIQIQLQWVHKNETEEWTDTITKIDGLTRARLQCKKTCRYKIVNQYAKRTRKGWFSGSFQEGIFSMMCKTIND